MAGSHSNGGITGGRMYRLEGSWYPIDPLIGGPPSIPGSPCPAEPNLFQVLELVVGPTTEVSPDADPTSTWPDAPTLGSACVDRTA
jgi:hypothetical protein